MDNKNKQPSRARGSSSAARPPTAPAPAHTPLGRPSAAQEVFDNRDLVNKILQRTTLSSLKHLTVASTFKNQLGKVKLSKPIEDLIAMYNIKVTAGAKPATFKITFNCPITRYNAQQLQGEVTISTNGRCRLEINFIPLDVEGVLYTFKFMCVLLDKGDYGTPFIAVNIKPDITKLPKKLLSLNFYKQLSKILFIAVRSNRPLWGCSTRTFDKQKTMGVMYNFTYEKDVQLSNTYPNEIELKKKLVWTNTTVHSSYTEFEFTMFADGEKIRGESRYTPTSRRSNSPSSMHILIIIEKSKINKILGILKEINTFMPDIVQMSWIDANKLTDAPAQKMDDIRAAYKNVRVSIHTPFMYSEEIEDV